MFYIIKTGYHFNIKINVLTNVLNNVSFYIFFFKHFYFVTVEIKLKNK